jgi:CDP-diacylglycerol--glycerol-3-phosphate 3-phosphatidyltransferase
MQILTIPNLFSLARLPLAAAFLLTQDTTARVAIIVAVAASDFLDGWWARRWGPKTRAGAVLDPVTDKVFIVTALVAFAIHGELGAGQLAVLLARDVFVAVGAAVVIALRLRLELQARFPGKLVTVLQIAAVLVLTVAPRAAPALVVITAAASAWAVADYAAAAARALRSSAPAR